MENAPTVSDDTVLHVGDKASAPTSSYLSVKNPYFKPLALLHLLVYGGFAVLAIGTSLVMVRWDIIGEMLRLDRLSAAAQTREEWSVLQSQISAYLWRGDFVTGGWGVALVYVALLLLTLTVCWVIVNMTSVRIVSLKKPIGAFDAFIFITPNLIAGLVPFLAWLAVVSGILISRVLPKFTNAELYTGSWKVLDVIGALPIAVIFTLILAIAWMFLIPMVVLSESPSRAWLKSPRLVLSMPGFAVGRWAAYSLLSLVFITLMVISVQQVVSNFSLQPFPLAVLSGTAFVFAMASTTWVTIKMMRLWQTSSTERDEHRELDNEIAFLVPDSGAHFQTEQAEWSEGEVGEDEVPIYIPTLDGQVITLEPEEKEVDTSTMGSEGLLTDSPEPELVEDDDEDDLYPLSSFPIAAASAEALVSLPATSMKEHAIQPAEDTHEVPSGSEATETAPSIGSHRSHRKSAPPLAKKKTVKSTPVVETPTPPSPEEETVLVLETLDASKGTTTDALSNSSQAGQNQGEEGGEKVPSGSEEPPVVNKENSKSSLHRKKPPRLRKR